MVAKLSHFEAEEKQKLLATTIQIDAGIKMMEECNCSLKPRN
jgi:hypothetical protein